MDSITMLRTASVLFALTALGGVVMAAIRFRGRPHPPSWMAMGHGLLAGAGLTLLVYAAVAGEVPAGAVIAAVLFALAAAGGVVLNLAYHLRDRPLPKSLVIVHALIAVTAFVLLLAASFG
jgi:uncharacterized membrane protein HdeD (DUF308 family)